jgi:hypothetical protein
MSELHQLKAALSCFKLLVQSERYSVYLLYWYKTTNTDSFFTLQSAYIPASIVC